MNINHVLPNPSITSLGKHPPVNTNIKTMALPVRDKKHVSPIESNLEGFGGQFYHNNMVPFHSGKVKQNLNVCSSKLNYLPGSSSEPRVKKIEQPNMFALKENIVNTNNSNAHNFKSKVQLPAYHNNTVPVEQVKVAPALGSGYDSKGADGFHSLYRPEHKTIDKLHVKPKMTGLEGRIITGLKSENRGIIGKVNKNSQEQVYENRSDYSSVIGNIVSKIRNVFSVDETRRSEIGHNERIGNADGVTKKIVNKENAPMFKCDREIIYNTRTGNASLNNKKHIIGIQDKIRKTHRESYEDSTFAGSVSNTAKQQMQLMDKQKQTIRETTEDKSITGTMKGHSANQATLMDQARPTLRQTTESESRTGNVQNGESKGSYVSDGVDAPNTIREEMTEETRAGHIGQRESTGNYVSDGINAPDTMRQETENSYRLGDVGGLEFAGHTFDLDDKLDDTMREMLQKEGILTGAASAHKVGLEDDARPTIRQETGLSTVTGNIGASKENSYFANEQDARPTLRESTGELSTTGGIGTLTQAATKMHLQDEARHTLKEVTEDKTTTGHLAQNSKGTAQVQDEIRPTMRENTESSTITANPDMHKSAYAVLPDKMKSTIREVTGDKTVTGNMGNIYELGTLGPQDELRHSLREDTALQSITPAPDGKAGQDAYLLSEYEVLHTLKEDTLNEDYLGQKGSSDKTKSMDKLQYENAKTNDLVEKTLTNRDMNYQGNKNSLDSSQYVLQHNNRGISEVETPLLIGKIPVNSIPDTNNMGMFESYNKDKSY